MNMSSVAAPLTVDAPDAEAPSGAPKHLSPNQRAWLRFKRNRVGYIALWVLVGMLVVSTLAELIANDLPFVARHEGRWYFPMIHNPTDRELGGDFDTQVDWHDPFIRSNIAKPGNFALFTLIDHSARSVNNFALEADPAKPSSSHWLGTDESGRDLLARLIYGFRVSVWFGFALMLTGIAIGLLAGAVQGYFGGRIDLAGQRFIEIWNSIPELYLLIIFASIFEPSILLLLVLLSLFGWVSLSDYVRAEFLRNRGLEFVKAARALGLSNWQIIWRHVLPNSMTPVITFLPFRMSAAILALTSLDFLGLGVPSPTPSLGDLLRQGKENLDSWWITVPTFALLVLTLLLLTLIGDALRDAFDTRKS